MKIPFTTIAIISLVAVSTASADHQSQPGKLAHALHVQAHNLEQEIKLHYPHSHGVQQRTYMISRLAKSAEYHVKNGNSLAARQTLGYLHGMLDDVDSFLRKSISHGRKDGRHVLQNVTEMEDLTDSLDHLLSRTILIIPGRGHSHVHILSGGHDHRGGGRSGRIGGLDTHNHGSHSGHEHGRVRNDDYSHGDRHAGHDHGRDNSHAHNHGREDRHDHGDRHAHRDHDRHTPQNSWVVKPGMIQINKENFKVSISGRGR